jgi:hypothetical protein
VARALDLHRVGKPPKRGRRVLVTVLAIFVGVFIVGMLSGGTGEAAETKASPRTPP